MMMLLLQIFLLLLAAYLFGAMLACGLRRAIATQPRDEQAAWRRAQMAPDGTMLAGTAAGGPVGEERFGRALSGDEAASAATASPPVVEVQPAPAAAETTRAPSAATIAAASAAAAAASHALSQQRPAPGAPAPAPAAPVATGPADDLKQIRTIDADTEERLVALGTSTFKQIAEWTAADVNRMSQALGFAGRIEKENWIEQAQILAKGELTEYARRMRDGEKAPPVTPPSAPPSTTTAASAAPAAAAATVAAAAASTAARPVNLAEAIRTNEVEKAQSPAEAAEVPSDESKADYSHLRSVRSEALRSDSSVPLEPTSHDDLKRIRGIGVLIEKKLNALGILSYEQIANWTGADLKHYSQYVEPHGRIERENWIEQARILASGGQTDYARRFDRGEVDAGG